MMFLLLVVMGMMIVGMIFLGLVMATAVLAFVAYGWMKPTQGGIQDEKVAREQGESQGA